MQTTVEKGLFLLGSMLFLLIHAEKHLAGPGVGNHTTPWKIWCLQDKHCVPVTTCQRPLTVGGWTVCLDHILRGNHMLAKSSCLIYSVGIADNWEFDKVFNALKLKYLSM